MTTPTPEQRPALRKADDHDLHPAQPRVDDLSDLSTKAGSTTADAISGAEKRDKLVRLELQVPKSLRKRLRSEAERRGMSVDDLVVALLRDRTDG